MPDPTRYNLDYRPASYWTAPGEREPLSPTVVWRYTRRTPLLDPAVDFLPEREGGEVEIACILLASVTGDMISIRARRRGKRIVYRVEDEYDTRFRFKPKRSEQPLTMSELVALIDGATGHLGGRAKVLTSAYRDYNAAYSNLSGLARLVNFVTVASDFYPQLHEYYREEAEEWLEAATSKWSRC